MNGAKSHTKSSRGMWITLVIISLLLGAPAVWIVGEYQRRQQSFALFTAIHQNRTQDALAALRAGADPNARDQGEKTPSLGAFIQDYWTQLRSGKQISNKNGPSALMLAVQQANTDLVGALLDRGAKDNGETFQEVSEDTPATLLMIAASLDNPAIIRALIKHGSDANVRD